MGHAPRSIAESRQVASSEIRRLKASPAGSSIERKAERDAIAGDRTPASTSP